MQNSIKDFLSRGYGFDLALAILSGFAIYSLLQNVILPVIGLVTGPIDFSNKYIALRKVPSGIPVEDASGIAPVIAYGRCIHEIWHFAVIGLVVYLSFRVFKVLVDRRDTKRS